jgi:predicted amidohydrolase
VGKLWEMTGSGESAIVSNDGRVLAKSAKGVESILSYEVDLP